MTNINYRLSKVKKELELQEIPALLICKGVNQVYLSNFHSGNCYIVITKDKNYILTDFRYIESASDLEPLYEPILIGNDNTVFNFLQKKGFSKIAVEEKNISLSFYRELKEVFKGEIIAGDGIVEEIRTVKDIDELNAITKAQSLTDQCFTHILNYIKPGLTEIEVALEIEIYLRKHGAEKLSFDTICVSGVRTSLPHGLPSKKTLKKGEFVTIDFGCVVEGYCSDMTRTFALGTVSQEQKHIYNLVLEAQTAGCDVIKEDITCYYADKVVRDIISDRGYGKQFGHGTGHGVGLEVHEMPTLNPRSKDVLKENMVVTIEPGIYLPGKFGVRIEDLAIVTSSSIINLTKSNKELIVI